MNLDREKKKNDYHINEKTITYQQYHLIPITFTLLNITKNLMNYECFMIK